MDAAASSRQWGVTPPISIARPTDKELALNEALINELKKQKNFESAEETEKRTTVLKSLHAVTVAFVKLVAQKKGLSTSVVNEGGGKVFTYGSYRLGVFGPGSDIDTLVVVPKHVSRDDFFQYFPNLLNEMAPAGAIEELKPVPDAFVPIIKLEYSGISIDMIFVRLHVSSVPSSLDLKDNSLLRGLDETDLRCVNGTRVADELMSLVPQVKTFRHALRAIKLWAQRRAVYANVMGFPGGVAWALMVARICQLYPQASGSVVVGKFFHLMSTWPWPRPIMLKNIEDGPLQVKVWNPAIYPGDKHHLMPIITPAYPSMCATHNITPSTKKIVKREMDRAKEIATKISDGKMQWHDLFQKHTFFTKDYKYYLSIIASSKTKEAQLIWAGMVESKVRRLVTGIEASQAGVELVHPFTKGFERIHHPRTEEELDKVLQGSLEFQAADTKTETTDVTNDIAQSATTDGNAESAEMPKTNGESSGVNGHGHMTIYTTTYYVGIELGKENKSLDISFPVADFKRLCTDWPQYDNDLNHIRIVHTRNYDLPDDVFDSGEERPVKTKKSKAAKSSESSAKKRSFAESNLENGKEVDVKRHQTQAPGIHCTVSQCCETLRRIRAERADRSLRWARNIPSDAIPNWLNQNQQKSIHPRKKVIEAEKPENRGSMEKKT